jgi:hypothetical protein
MLSSEIERAKIADFDRNEKTLAVKLAEALPPLASELDGATLRRLQVFVSFCNDNGIRYCPARPATVAAFILAQVGNGEIQDRVLELIAAIELLHDKHGLANPVATGIARRALGHVSKIEPPRSWLAHEKLLFLSLPPDIQAPITRRDNDREKVMRRLQNETAELRRQAGAETNPTDAKKELRNDN